MSDKLWNLIKRVGAVVGLVSLVAYTAFHIFSLFTDNITTVVVASALEQRIVAMDGYIFRDESVLYSEYGGAVDYIAEDGEKISIGQALATVYEKGNNASITSSLEHIDREIEILSKGTRSTQSLADLPGIREDISSACSDIAKKLASGQIKNISDSIDALRVALIGESFVTGGGASAKDTLRELEEQKEHLRDAGGAKLQEVSEKSGYFYSDIDGYESLFTIAEADSLSIGRFEELIRSSPAEPFVGNAYGKIALESEWRFVCPIDAAGAEYFEEGSTYEAIFTENGGVAFPLTLLKEISEEGNATRLLVFECNRAPSDFDFARHQSIEAIVQSVKGISVPKSAVHKSEGEYSVYILQGSVVRERRIRISFEGSDYYIVEDGVPKDESGTYLQSNDLLILEGKNLFDGRILE